MMVYDRTSAGRKALKEFNTAYNNYRESKRDYIFCLVHVLLCNRQTLCIIFPSKPFVFQFTETCKFIFKQIAIILRRNQKTNFISISFALYTSRSIEFKIDFLTWPKSLFREFIMGIRLCPVGEVISGYIVSARFSAQSLFPPSTHSLIVLLHAIQARKLLFTERVQSFHIIYIYSNIFMVVSNTAIIILVVGFLTQRERSQ